MNFTYFLREGESSPEVHAGCWKSFMFLREGGLLLVFTEAFGRISRIFLVKVDSDPEVDFRAPVAVRTWKSEH